MSFTNPKNLPEFPPDSWVFVCNAKTGQVMVLGPNREVPNQEIIEVIVQMQTVMGRLAKMVTNEIELNPNQAMMVEPKNGGRKDN